SLYILLTSGAGRAMLATVRTVIVDEIHAVSGSKRGAHLALSLERLEAPAQRPIQRIGPSATQEAIEDVAEMLVGVGARGGSGGTWATSAGSIWRSRFRTRRSRPCARPTPGRKSSGAWPS